MGNRWICRRRLLADGLSGGLKIPLPRSSHAPACLLNRLPEPRPSYPLLPLPLAAPGPVNAEGFSPDLFFAHKSPKPAVQTLITVVSHDEIGIGRHRHRAEVIARIDRAVDHTRIDALRKRLVVQRRPLTTPLCS